MPFITPTLLTETPTDWVFEVMVGEGGNFTKHIVTVPKEYLEKLRLVNRDPEEIVRWSFKFLLVREPKESILREFSLSIIQRYFPEFEEMVKVMTEKLK